MKLSVIIPVYGSEKILPKLYERLKGVLQSNYPQHEIIFVDDCGPGASWSVIKGLCARDPDVKGVQLMKNSGQGSATLSGLSIAGGDIIVTMDDDLQHPPEELPKLVGALINDEELDVVIGATIEKKHNFIRRLGSNIINSMNSSFLNKDKSLRFTGFRAMRPNVAGELIKISTHYPALGPMILSVTRRVKNIPFDHQARDSGRSNYSFMKLYKQTLSNFIGYSMLPLRMLATLGLIGILFSIVLGLYFLWRYFFVGISTSGWTSTILVLISISGFNFFAFAILGEYILRISQTTTDTPQYTIRKTLNHQLNNEE